MLRGSLSAGRLKYSVATFYCYTAERKNFDFSLIKTEVLSRPLDANLREIHKFPREKFLVLSHFPIEYIIFAKRKRTTEFFKLISRELFHWKRPLVIYA